MKTILITGATSGIGEALCLHYQTMGYQLIACGRNVEKLAQLETYQRISCIEVDLCNRSDAVICDSDNDRQRLLHDGVKPNLLHTIPHGSNPEPYKLPAIETLREDFQLSENAILIAFHGTFS